MGKNMKMQKAMEYSVYENLLVAAWDGGNDIKEASIFKTEQLYLNYMDVAEAKKREVERIAARLVDKMRKKVTTHMFHSFKTIRIVKANDAYHEIQLSGEGIVLRIMVDYKGTQSDIIFECWKKGGE